MTSGYEFRQKAESLLQGKYATPIVYILILGLVNSLTGAFVPKLEPGDALSAAESGLVSLSNLVSFVIDAGLAYGAVHLWRSVIQGVQPNLEQSLFAGFKTNFGRNIVLQLSIAIYTVLWMLLFIIPGIVKAYAYSMSFYLLHREPELDASAAITRSKQLTTGHKMRLFALDLGYLGWYVLGIFTFGILWLWVIPRHQVARMLMFEEIYALNNPVNTVTQPASIVG
ncbi:MAG: DUF975 family protein [Bacillus subtilis]|nr:DUF975 family protein [Bacillus subtilis]